MFVVVAPRQVEARRTSGPLPETRRVACEPPGSITAFSRLRLPRRRRSSRRRRQRARRGSRPSAANADSRASPTRSCRLRGDVVLRSTIPLPGASRLNRSRRRSVHTRPGPIVPPEGPASAVDYSQRRAGPAGADRLRELRSGARRGRPLLPALRRTRLVRRPRRRPAASLPRRPSSAGPAPSLPDLGPARRRDRADRADGRERRSSPCSPCSSGCSSSSAPPPSSGARSPASVADHPVDADADREEEYVRPGQARSRCRRCP